MLQSYLVLKTAISVNGVLGGPSLGLFLLGMTCKYADTETGLIAYLLGNAVGIWIVIGANLHPPGPEFKNIMPSSTEACMINGTIQPNYTPINILLEATMEKNTSVGNYSDSYNYYHISYLYFGAVGSITVLR